MRFGLLTPLRLAEIVNLVITGKITNHGGKILIKYFMSGYKNL